jgi:uncharacterized membrane protein
MAGDIFLLKDLGISFLFRWAHVFVGITWIGLLYFFNFVQVPAFAEMEPAARNNAMDKITWRALWWFRWSAFLTFLSGLVLLYYVQKDQTDFFKSGEGITIVIGMLLGVIMLCNVWGVIWRKQQIVIANARNVQAGGEADPAAPAAARAAAMASRQNAVFSLPLLFFMVGAPHFFIQAGTVSSGKSGAFQGISVVIMAILELNALGYMPWKKEAGKGLNWMYDTHKNAIISGFVLTLIFAILSEGLLLH